MMQASFKTYPKYKDSGVEWLGEIPEGWSGIRMKYLFRDVSKKNQPEQELLSVTQDQGVIPRTWVENRMVMPSGNLESFKFIAKGDFAISLRSFEGGLEYCHHDGIISPAYTVLEISPSLHPHYYKHLFKSQVFISELQTSVVGIREGKNISYPELSYSVMPSPPIKEQTAIATFLDEKVGKIDEAIAQKEQLIELLNERKQIIIQNAVTKGLNPNAPMKDSGIEWIGKIPEHWEVKRLKGFIDNLESGVSVNASEAEAAAINEVGVLKTSSVYGFRFNGFENKRVIKSDLSRVACPVKKGRIIISRMNAPDLVGASGLVTQEYPNLFLPDRLWQTVYNTRNEFSYEWLSICLASPMIKALLPTIAVGSSPSMKNISKGDFLNLSLPVPTISDQKNIVELINSETEKVDKAIVQTTQSILKLKEYKATLINSAVTGKIKVPS